MTNKHLFSLCIAIATAITAPFAISATKTTAPEQTDLLLEHHFTLTGETVALDATNYRQIRVTFNDCSHINARGEPTAYLEIYAVSPSGQRYTIQKGSPSCSGGEISWTFEIPGRQLELSVGTLASPDFSIAVYGRSN